MPGVVPVKTTVPLPILLVPSVPTVHKYPEPDILPDRAIEPVFKVPLLPLPLSFTDADITKGIAVDVSNQYP